MENRFSVAWMHRYRPTPRQIVLGAIACAVFGSAMATREMLVGLWPRAMVSATAAGCLALAMIWIASYGVKS